MSGVSLPFQGVPPVVALVGDEERRKELLLAAIEERAGSGAARIAWSAEAGEKPAAEFARLLLDLRTKPLFGGAKLIVVRDGDALVQRAGGDAPKLLEVDAGNHLVLLCQKLDLRTSFARALNARKAVLRCERPKADLAHFDLRGGGRSELVDAVMAEARTKGLALAPDAAAELAGRTGNDLLRVASELEKLALLLGAAPGGATPATVADVEASVPRSAAYDQFRLFEEVATGDAAAALARVRGMLRDGTLDARGKRKTDASSIGLALLALLHQRLKLLASLCAHRARGLRGADLQRAAGVKNPNQMYFLEREASLPLVQRADRAAARIADADRALKGGEPPDLALETLIVALARLAVEGRGAPRRVAAGGGP